MTQEAEPPGDSASDATTPMRRFIDDESGATAVEYGILLTLISLVVLAGISQAHTAISTLFTNIASVLART